MALIKDDAYLLEEEKKKKKKALGIGGGLSVTPAKPAIGIGGNVKIAPKPKAAAPQFDIRTTAHADIQTIARQEQATSAQQKGTLKSPIAEYFKMVQEQGADAVNKRIEDATSIWRRYYKPYPGPATVWNMAKSSYTMPQLEQMAQHGQSVLFNYNPDNKQNYVPGSTTDGSKDTNLLRASLNFFQPTKAQMGIGGAVAVGSNYEQKPYGYGTVMPSELLQSNAEYITKSNEYKSAMEIQTNYEKWGNEFQSANPKIVSNLEALTGIARGSVRSWQEWEGKLKEWKDQQKFSKAAKFDDAFNAFSDKRTKFLAENHGDVLNARGLEVGVGLAQAGLTAVGLYATGAGLGSFGSLGLFGKVATLGGTGMFASQAASAKFDPEERTQRAADEQRMKFEGVVKTTSQRQYEDTMAVVSKLDTNGDRESIKKIQAELQKPVLAEDGTIIRVPLGQGLVVDGQLTSEWRGVIQQAADFQVRESADLQQSLIAGGYAPRDSQITGTFEKWDETAQEWVPDEDWKDALTKAQGDWAAQSKMAEGNPLWYSFMKASGLPMSWDGVKALGTRLTNEGWPYAPLKALAQSGYYMGGLVNAVPAVLETKMRLDKDPARQALREQLIAAVKANLPTATTPDVPFDVSADDLSAGKAQYLVENGNVADPEAQRIVKELNKGEAAMLAEPSYGWVGMFGYMTQDYDKTHAWLTENYNAVHALNMAIDVLGQAAIAKGAKIVGSGVGRTAEAFSADGRATRTLNRIVKMGNAGDIGNVAALVGGTDARVFAKRLADYRYGRKVYTKDAAVVKAKSGQLLGAAAAGDKDGVLALLGEYGKTPQAAKFADNIIDKTNRVVKRTQERAADFVGPVAPAAISKGRPVTEVITGNIVARQAGKGDVWGVLEVKGHAQKIAEDMWSGADGTYYDVFPHLMRKDTKSKSYTRISLERAVAGMNDGKMRDVASALLLPLYRAPVHSYSSNLADFPNRVADFVGAVTNDVSLVNRWRTKTALTDFSKPRAAQRFEAELQALRGEYLQGGVNKMSLAAKLDHELADPSIIERGVDQLTGLKISGGEKDAAQFVGRYQEGGVEKERVMQTSQIKTEIKLGRDVMLAGIRTKGGGSALAAGYDKTRNGFRRVERGLTAVSTPMRVISVGAGAPVLVQKHAFADTGRSVVSEGLGVLRFKHNQKGFKAAVDQVGPEAADRVLFERKVAIENEQHYNLEGGIEVTRQALKTFNDKGIPKNMSGAIDTVRHIIMDGGLRAYAQGGQEGLIAWANSSAGRKFLATSGWFRNVNDGMKVLEGKVVAQTTKQIGTEQFIHDKLELLHDYEQLPTLYKSMQDMAAGIAPRHDSDIRTAIMDAWTKGKENPTVDVPIESGNMGINLFAKATKIAMTPNRINREAVFNKVFNEVFNDLTKKQGVNADNAAVIASTVARTRTGQVHFDLSEGMRFEMKHRWFAWFGTKHRLWNTWLATAAVKYPGYAAALNEYAKWMEERNADESISDWEKHNIVANVGGKRLSINLAPYAWLMDYAIESPFGNLIENGALTTINKLAGTDIKPAPDSFGFSLTRFDPMVKSVWRWIHAPKGDDKGEWQTFIADMPEKEREKFSEQVTTVWALSEGKKTIEECEKEVLVGNIKQEAYRFGKPASSKFYHEDQVDLFKARAEYNKIAGTPQASEFLKFNPQFAMTIGAGSRDPYAQQELNSALSAYTDIKNRYQQTVVASWKTGQLEDTNFAANLYQQEQVEIDKLKAESPAFKSWMGDTGEDTETFAQTAHYAFPSVDPSEWESARIPTGDEQAIYRQTLEQQFETTCQAYGVNPNSNSAVVKMLRHNTVELPMAEYDKSLPGDLAVGVRNNARILALADVNGLFRSSQYVETMTSKVKRDMWLSGTKYAKPDANNLLMMMLSPDEKAYLGWKTDEQSSQMWLQYGIRRAQIEDYTSSIGKSTSSKVYKDMMTALGSEIETQWLPQSKTFAQEWNFSHMRLDERMQSLGYGKGPTQPAQGWQDFFDLMNGYWGTLDKTYNVSTKKLGVSPMAQAAAPVNRTYLKQLVALSKKNKDWYTEWKYLGFGPSKVGFYSHWRLADNSDAELWAKDEPVDETELANIYGEE